MVEFDTSPEKKKIIDLIESLYAICGEDEGGKTRLLVFGYEFASAKIPVIELTSPLQSCRRYGKWDSITKICEDFGINPQTARYFDDYNSFALMFRSNQKED